jgi:hypothetical protein
MSGINRASTSPTASIQHSPSQASEPVPLKIETVDQARDHWRTITSPLQAEEAMIALEEKAEGGHLSDEQTYLLLANALRDLHSTL